MTPVVVSWGGGVNSTAILVGLYERGERPDLILFADTGGEKPDTYAYRDVIDRWLLSSGFPPIVVVRATRLYPTLEAESLARNQLPAIAYGYRTCSQAWKTWPQQRYLKTWAPALEAWARGETVTKLIGFDADEPARARSYEEEGYAIRYPLIEWQWGREECVRHVKAAGLPVPAKSACFFCPSSKKHEVIRLSREHPDLFARAVAMERNANLVTIEGLGRNWSWEQLVAVDEAQQKLFPEAPELNCIECSDGDPLGDSHGGYTR